MTDNVTKIRCIEIDNEMSVEWWYQNEQRTIFKIYFLVQCSITWTIYFYCIVQKTTVIFMWRFCGSCINATIYQTSQFFIFLLNIIRCCCWLQTQKTSKYVFRSITIFSWKMKIIVTERYSWSNLLYYSNVEDIEITYSNVLPPRITNLQMKNEIFWWHIKHVLLVSNSLCTMLLLKLLMSFKQF